MLVAAQVWAANGCYRVHAAAAAMITAAAAAAGSCRQIDMHCDSSAEVWGGKGPKNCCEMVSHVLCRCFARTRTEGGLTHLVFFGAPMADYRNNAASLTSAAAAAARDEDNEIAAS